MQYPSLAEASVHMLRSALGYPVQHTPPWPRADTGIQDESRAMASPVSQVQADRDLCSSCPPPVEALALAGSCPARGLLGYSRQNRPSVQMGKMLRYAV